MSRLPEQRLWDRIRAKNRGRVRMERIENLVGVGRPDVDTLVNGSFLPVELKAIKDWPARATTKVLGRKGLRLDQRNWHLDWRRWGGKSLVVVGVGREVYSFVGAHADVINDFVREDFELHACAIGIEELIQHMLREGGAAQ